MRVTSALGRIAAFASVILLPAGAKAGDVVLSAGQSFSSGLGESTVSPALKAAYASPALEVAGSFDLSRKVETGAGWVAGFDVDARAFGPVRIGADYRHRNGGTWSKNVLFTRLGLDMGAVRLLYRHEVASDAGASRNHGKVLQISRRFTSSGAHRVAFEPSLGVMRYKRFDGSQGTGVLMQLWLGMARSTSGTSSR